MENTKNILNLLPEYEGIIYDFDGTIATIDIDWNNLKNELSSFMKKSFWVDMLFTPLDSVLHTCKEIYGSETYERLLQIIEINENRSQLKEYNLQLINYIKNSHQKQALFSMNTQKALEKFIFEIFGEQHPFEIIISKNSCLKVKPSKQDLEKISLLWWIWKKQLVYVGNSLVDTISWELANIKTYIV